VAAGFGVKEAEVRGLVGCDLRGEVRSSCELNVSDAPRYASMNALSSATPVFRRDLPVFVTLAGILNARP
jgi:hypothetical protein